jgi:glycosyltransferase involved in cell wall biosynthesis
VAEARTETAGPRVLFLCSTLAVGGAERQLALLVPALRERGVRPTVVTLRHRGRNFETLRLQGIDVRFAHMRSRADVYGAWCAYRLWRTRPDVVFSRSVDAQLIGHLLARRCGAAHVTAEHGGAGIRRRAHHRAVLRLVAPRVDQVVAVSPSQADDLERVGYRAGQIVVIPNGIPDSMATRSPADVRGELRIAATDFLAVLVATLRPEKRADLFVDAVAAAHRRDPRIRGVVAGGGPELDAVRRRAAMADAVTVLGERGDAADLMAAADVVCLSSSVEGLPMTVLEAMAVGRPVVAPSVGGLSDAVESGQNGWLVAAGDSAAYTDALVAAASDTERLRTMGLAGRQVFEERFTLDRMADRYTAMLNRLVTGEKRADRT